MTLLSRKVEAQVSIAPDPANPLVTKPAIADSYTFDQVSGMGTIPALTEPMIGEAIVHADIDNASPVNIFGAINLFPGDTITLAWQDAIPVITATGDLLTVIRFYNQPQP